MFPPDAPDGSAGAGAPVSDAQLRFPLGASRDATSRRIPPLPTTSEPDWAKPRRVAFCVGDDAAAVADAWAWTAARFLEPTDDVIMLRVWCPDAAAFRSDVDPDYAAEVDFHQERTTTSWLPPSVRDSLARREASFSGSHSHVVLRDVHANLSPARQIARYCARNAVDVVVLGARPRRGAIARALLGTVSDAVVRNSPCPCLVLRRGGSANVAGVEIASGPGAVPSADSGSTSPGSPGPPDFGPAGRPGPSPGTFARPSPGTFARPTPRRVVIAVDGSDASSRAVRWCRDALLRPTDEVILAHAVSGVSERAFSRVYAERGVASRPAGGDDAHAAAATRDAWRALERALERAGTTPPYPSLGDGQGQSPGRPGAAFLGEDAARLARAFPERAPWRRLDKLLAVVAAKQGAYRCGWPPRGAATLGPPRDGALRAAKDADADLIVVGSRATGGWRRAMSPSVSTHLVENAPCPCLVYREPAREDEGGEGGERVGHT